MDADFMGPHEPSSNPFALFDDAVQASTRSVTALINARNNVRDALKGGQTVAAPATGPQTTSGSGTGNLILFALLAVVLVKVLK